MEKSDTEWSSTIRYKLRSVLTLSRHLDITRLPVRDIGLSVTIFTSEMTLSCILSLCWISITREKCSLKYPSSDLTSSGK